MDNKKKTKILTILGGIGTVVATVAEVLLLFCSDDEDKKTPQISGGDEECKK